MSVGLVTRGMIQSCCQRDQIVSFDKPAVKAVIELRPRTESAESTACDLHPYIASAEEED